MSSTLMFAQKINVSGTVVDEIDDLPLVFVDITINNEKKLGMTNFDGEFSIEVSKIDTLTFSLDGYETKKIRVVNNKLNVSLKQKPSDDVVVIGFGQKYQWCCPTLISPDQIVYNGKPKTFFKENKERNLFIVFVKELNPTLKTEKDTVFERDYNIQYYSQANGWDAKFVSKYNKLTFKHLKKRYKKKWLDEIRKDAIEIEKYLK
jgi:hypothetical protein